MRDEEHEQQMAQEGHYRNQNPWPKLILGLVLFGAGILSAVVIWETHTAPGWFLVSLGLAVWGIVTLVPIFKKEINDQREYMERNS